MKTLFSSALLMIGSFSAFSQDTLFTRSGQVILGKVYEINQTDIKYKKPSNPNGPLYTVSKEDITLIEFKNGTKEVFQSSNQAGQGDNTNSNDNNSNSTAAAPQVNNNYYGNPSPRPNVNVVLGGMGMGMMGYGYGAPYWGGWGYRPYYRPYRNYYGGGWGWGGGWHSHHYHRR